ncbi:hypothetical protein E9232_006368 [Inquilinus ginsengisoli]|uniref:Cyanovirin-N domain-containing protein n=1 Tax=Inquilinus ginsengisoli TaxID=363840 RepID=A0ABU1JYV9_9PROT|nr:hypothetical protein [Inquilinus ginsengisoli]MDR6293815.1 hypothetical protein [Inquilinus ginsengisoli]
MLWRVFLAAIATVSISVSTNAVRAQEKDGVNLNCALLLCLPGGFPSVAICGSAHAYMIQRLLDGKSPIGTCPMSDGSSFTDDDYNYRTGQHFYCDDGLTLARRDSSSESGYTDINGDFILARADGCYRKTAYQEYRCVGSYGRDGNCRYKWVTLYRYQRVTAPKGGRFMQLTLYPGTADAFDSGRIYY